MCGIWDWQSTIVKDLNDSQDPKHTLFCREIVFVAIYALFSDNKCPLFTRLGGGSPKADIVRFFYRFSYRKASLMYCFSKLLFIEVFNVAEIICCKPRSTSESNAKIYYEAYKAQC